MKTINKRIYRGIGKNFSFYISSIFLTSIAVVLFLAEVSAGNTVEKNYIGFMEQNHIEDANFSTMIPLEENDIEKLSADYNLVIEAQEYIDQEEEGFTLRIFKGSNKINTYEVVEGSDISSDTQVLLSRGFMNANGLSVGDGIVIAGESYKIAGIVEKPDYLYMLHNETDIYHSNAAFGLAIMTDNAVDEIGSAAKLYSVIYNDKSKEKVEAFRHELYESFLTVSYTSAENNTRIKKIGEVRGTCISTGYSVIAVMSILVVFVLSLILGRIVKRDGKQIGTLTAFGLRNNEIQRHYMWYGFIPGILGSALGIILSLLLAEPLVMYSLSNIEYLEGSINIDKKALLLSVVVPALLYSLTAMYTARKLLGKYRTVELLSGRIEGSRKSRGMILTNSNWNVRAKFRVRTLFTSKKRTAVAAIGMFLGALFILFGYTMTDSVNQSFEHGFDDMGKYNYQYILSEAGFGNPEDDAEAMVIGSFELADTCETISVFGVEEESQLVNVAVGDSDFDGDKYYVTSIASIVYGLKEGDTVEIYNPLSLKKEKIEIAGVIPNAVSTGIFSGRENVCSLMGVDDKTFYNAIVSEDELRNEDELQIYNKIEKDALGAQMEEAASALNVLLYMFFVMGIIVCVVFVYICVNQIVSENLLNISMFKVLGYRNKEINNMVLDSYTVFVPVVFAIAIPSALKVTQIMLDRYAALYHFEGHAKIEITSIIISAVIFAISYFVSLFVLRRKVFHANMVEVMKDHKE